MTNIPPIKHEGIINLVFFLLSIIIASTTAVTIPKELAEIISLETSNSITKSGLNHRLRKIKELAERFEKQNIQ